MDPRHPLERENSTKQLRTSDKSSLTPLDPGLTWVPGRNWASEMLEIHGNWASEMVMSPRKMGGSSYDFTSILGMMYRKLAFLIVKLIQSPFCFIKTILLVGGLEHFWFYPKVGMMIQSDEFIFFRGVGQPPISLSTMLDHAPKFCFCTEQQTKNITSALELLCFYSFGFVPCCCWFALSNLYHALLPFWPQKM